MTHLVIGLYTQEGSTGVWANLEYDTYAIEGTIATGGADSWTTLRTILDADVKIIRPKRLSIYSNDRGLVDAFTPPIRLTIEQLSIMRGLFRYDKWKFYLAQEANLRRAKEQWTLYKNAGKNI